MQGVFFRVFIKKKAGSLGVSGFVRNEADGSVYVEAEGEERSLKELVEWCQRGPWLANVDRVEVGEDQLKHYEGFNISR